jgi:NAD(P)-dependent dehydrogenase (short-subunit alcohol dehydrogenase family)
MTGTKRLAGQTVVVIGGSSGIGLATARAARDAGADVVITGRSPQRLETAAAGLGDTVRAVALDALDEAGTATLFEELPIVHHVFVSAGTVGAGPLSAPTERLRPLLDTRLWGSVFAVRAAAPKMTDGGSITLCSGVSSMRPRRGGSPVSAASAGAVEALARNLAVELAPVRVNTIIPGLVDTPLVATLFGEGHQAAMEAAGKSLPVGRVGQPEDLADAVLFLMGNGYVTGINLVVDGGRLLV